MNSNVNRNNPRKVNDYLFYLVDIKSSGRLQVCSPGFDVTQNNRPRPIVGSKPRPLAELPLCVCVRLENGNLAILPQIWARYPPRTVRSVYYFMQIIFIVYIYLCCYILFWFLFFGVEGVIIVLLLLLLLEVVVILFSISSILLFLQVQICRK